MKVNLDEQTPALPAWDFTIESGGVEYRVRELAAADVETMLRIAAAGNNADAIVFLKSLFEGAAPPVEKWNALQAATFLQAVTTYATARIKNTLAIVRQHTGGQRFGGVMN
jgi:hypothetical protein